MTREDVAKRAKDGESLVIILNKVYNLTKWMGFHPGGPLAIKNMAGIFKKIKNRQVFF